jgi:endonuclease YncB( thermonuclease family)
VYYRGVKSKKKPSLLKKFALGGITTGIVVAISAGFWASQTFYRVAEVIDGDTFKTESNLYIRFDGVDAPEIQNCMGEKSKQELTKLIFGKNVFIKVNLIEKNQNHSIVTIYGENGNIEEKMLKEGLVTLRSTGGNSALEKASEAAMNAKAGVYSEECTQSVNPRNTKCNIKGSVRMGQKFYNYVGCNQYNTTLVQLYLGDKWFCSEKEALDAGFIKGKDCP